MKNRKKIFIFFVLLCTIFGTLLFINPTSKAVDNWDNLISLQGATVSVPSNWTATAGYGRFDVGVIVNGNDFSKIADREFDIGYAFDPINLRIFSQANTITFGVSAFFDFNSSTALTIQFINGDDLTNSLLINWLVSNNATIVGGIYDTPDPTYTISGQYQFNEEITWLYDTSEQEGILYLPFYVYNLDNSTRVNYDYMLNQNREDLGINYFLYANETDSGTFIGEYAGRFTTSTTINMFGDERIIYFYTADVSEGLYTWLNENGRFINDSTLDPNNPDNPDSGNNPNNPNNPDFGTDTVRQIINQVNAFLGIQILPGLSFRDILLICIALPLLMYILKVFLGG